MLGLELKVNKINMNKKTIVFIVIIIMTSCVDNEISTKNKANNFIKTYSFKSTKDTSLYYKDGNLYAKGTINNELDRVGDWFYYNKKGLLSEMRQYVLYNQKSYLNKNIFFNEEGNQVYFGNKEFNTYPTKYSSDTIPYFRSHFADFLIHSDTVRLGDTLKGGVFYMTPLYREKNSKFIFVLENESKLDTFYNLNQNEYNKQAFPEDDPEYSAAFGKIINKTGKQKLRGWLSEYYYDVDSVKIEANIYFEKEFFGLDTL